MPPSIRFLHRPLLMISPGISRGASANLKTPFPGPLGISWQQRSHFQNVIWATLYWVPCIQSKLIVIDECEQRRPAQDLPNQTQLTLSGRRVFRRYSFLGTPPPNSWSSSVKQTASTWIFIGGKYHHSILAMLVKLSQTLLTHVCQFWAGKDSFSQILLVQVRQIGDLKDNKYGTFNFTDFRGSSFSHI